jgi:hypothetical protein
MELSSKSMKKSVDSLRRKLANNTEFIRKLRQHPSLDDPHWSFDFFELRFCAPRAIRPNQAMSIWLHCLESKPVCIEYCREWMENLCKRRKYKGKWMLVHKLLSFSSITLALTYLLDGHYHYRDISGNIVPTIGPLTGKVGLFWCQTRKARKQNFQRGYRDKGGRRLPHEFHGVPVPPKEQLDLSSLTMNSDPRKHQLLRFLYD